MKIINLLIKIKMTLIKHSKISAFNNSLINPKKTQATLLKKILSDNHHTTYGKKYSFTKINSYSDYAATVPITEYDDLQQYIEEQSLTGSKTLTAKQPIMYATTSGTTSKPKYIPITKDTLYQCQHTQAILSYAQYQSSNKPYEGRILVITSPAVEGKLNNGITYGSISGMIYQCLPKFLQKKYVLPYEILCIEDYNLKYFLIAAYAISYDDISFIGAVNPSTIIKIIDIINNNKKTLIQYLTSNELKGFNNIPKEISTLPKLSDMVDKKRIDKLSRLFLEKELVNYADLWPNLKAIGCWTGGSCSFLISKIESLIPKFTKIIELGYSSSEFRGSITIDVNANIQVPTLHETFFEFVAVEDWDSNKQNARTITIEQLQYGKQYYIIATTSAGLYRYFINDIIKVTGKYKNTPTIAFLQKGKGVTSITGEKLYEQQVIHAINTTKKQLGINIRFFLMLADVKQQKYVLYLDHLFIDKNEFITIFEQCLADLNIEFDAKRKSNRILQTEIIFLHKNIYDIYKEHCMVNNPRDLQFKLVHLQYADKINFNFEHYRISRIPDVA